MRLAIEPVNQENLDEVNEFLSAYEETAQFLINNLKQYGPRLLGSEIVTKKGLEFICMV